MQDLTLKQIVEQLKEARGTASIALDAVEPRVRSGVEGRVREAERNIGALEQAYRDKVSSTLLVVGLRGPGSKKFADLASESMLCVDQQMVVDIVTDSIQKRITHYNGFGAQELFAMMGELNEIKAKYAILSIPPIQNNGISSLVASMPLHKAVDTVLKTNYGFQLHSAVIRRHVVDTVLSKLYEGSGRLVLGIYNFQGIDPLLLPEPHVIVDLTEDVTPEIVEETLEKIRQSLRSPTQKKTRGKAAKEQENVG